MSSPHPIQRLLIYNLVQTRSTSPAWMDISSEMSICIMIIA